MKKRIIQVIVVLIMFIGIGIFCYTVLNPDESYRSIKVEQIEGNVELIRKTKSMSLSESMHLYNKDKVSTKKESHSILLLDYDKYAFVEENTKFRIVADGDEAQSKTRIHLDYGAISSEVQNKLDKNSYYEIQTPNSVMAVRGTAFRVEVTMVHGVYYTQMDVWEGEVTSYLIDESGSRKEEVNVPMGYRVLVRGNEVNAEYVLSNNEVLSEIDEDSYKLQTLKDMMIIIKHDKKDLFIHEEKVIELINRFGKQAESEVVSDSGPDPIQIEKEKPPIIKNEVHEPIVPIPPDLPMPPDPIPDIYHTLTLFVDNQVYQNFQIRAGEPVYLPVLSKQGYDFNGWQNKNQEIVDMIYIPSMDETLTVSFQPRSDTPYTIHYFVKEKLESEFSELVEMSEQRVATTDTMMIPTVEPTLTYNNNIALLQPLQEVKILGDGSTKIHVYYIYEEPEENSYKVVFIFKDNRESLSKDYIKNSKITELPVHSVLEHFKHVGWNTKKDGTGINVTENYIVNENIIIYEMMERTHVPYMIEYSIIDQETSEIIPYKKITYLGEPGDIPVMDPVDDITKDYKVFYQNLQAFIEKDKKYTVIYEPLEKGITINYLSTMEELPVTKVDVYPTSRYFYGLKNYGSYVSWKTIDNVLFPLGSIFQQSHDGLVLVADPMIKESSRKIDVKVKKENIFKKTYMTSNYQMLVDLDEGISQFTLPKNIYPGYAEAIGYNTCDFTLLSPDIPCELTFTYTLNLGNINLYMKANDTTIQKQIVANGKLPIPEDYGVTKEGYNFVGWKVKGTDTFITSITGGSSYDLEAYWE